MKRKNLWYYLTLAAIGLVIFAVTVLRHDETTTADTSPLTNAASAIFLAIMTLGPGLLAKEIFLRLLPVEQLCRDRRRLRRKIHSDEKKCREAAHKVEQRALYCRWYDEQRAMITAAYALGYKLAGGKVPLTMLPESPHMTIAHYPKAVS